MNEKGAIRTDEGIRGVEAYGRGEFARAAELFVEALIASSDPAERLALLIHLANARDELGDHVQALDALRLALDIDDGDTAVWNNIGVICIKIGRIDEAREALQRAISLNPGNVASLVSLGSLCLKRSDPGNAMEYLTRALEVAPGHPVAHANLALTLAVFGRIEDAEDELRLASMYGYSDAEAAQSLIDRMKAVRDSVQRRSRAEEDLEPGIEDGNAIP